MLTGSKAPFSSGVLVALLSAGVLLFRLNSYRHPSSFISNPPAAGLPLNGLGLLFLACGVWGWARNPGPPGRVLLLYGAAMGVHWGGSIGAESELAHIALLTLYAATTALGDGAFLDLALRLPKAVPRRGMVTLAPYSLAILTLVSAPAVLFLPRRVLEAGLGAVFGMAFLMSIAAGVVFLVTWFRSNPSERREHSLSSIAFALVASGVLDLLAEAAVLPGEPWNWKLAYGLVPVALARAIGGRGPVRGRSSRRSGSG
ncbi:MAG TPA: hypothetical protein VFP98_07155 [Candidatus Polarisedimenticolia bacterium]|nr:hypothetical protein [Candidatus Polarisedimenticolia bacterium]